MKAPTFFHNTNNCRPVSKWWMDGASSHPGVVFFLALILIASCSTDPAAAPSGTTNPLPEGIGSLSPTPQSTRFETNQAEVEEETRVTEIPTPVPIDVASYEGWWEYRHAVNDFKLFLPGDWVVEEITTRDPQGNQLNLHPKDSSGGETLRVTFRGRDEAVPLWPTGVGDGEFIPGGTLIVAGQAARRNYFVCPAGQINAIWYFGAENGIPIRLADLEFFFLYTYVDVYCREGYSLGGKGQLIAERIMTSLTEK